MTDNPDCYRPIEEPPPEGWILAHNNVRPRVGRRKGGLGFRAFWVRGKRSGKYVTAAGGRTWASIIVNGRKCVSIR